MVVSTEPDPPAPLVPDPPSPCIVLLTAPTPFSPIAISVMTDAVVSVEPVVGVVVALALRSQCLSRVNSVTAQNTKYREETILVLVVSLS